METCVQCRGCEPACPSGVPFGRLMEGTRAALAAERRTAPRWLRAGYSVLGRHRLLLAGSTRAGGRPTAAPDPGARSDSAACRCAEARRSSRRATTCGCSPAASWMRGCGPPTGPRPSCITRMGFTFSVPGTGGACCGALHTHAGLEPQARQLAERVIRSMPGDAPVLVNSAGCGAAMKDYGHLLDTRRGACVRGPGPRRPRVARRAPRPAAGRRFVRLGPVIVHDPCHLRHVQRAHGAVRTVVGHVADVVELDDEGLCCGAGGAYAALATGARPRDPRPQGRRDRAGCRAIRGDGRGERQPGVCDPPRRRRARRPAPGRPRRRGDRGMTRYEELAERLEAIGAELDELSFDLLQQAVADGATAAPGGRPHADPGPAGGREGRRPAASARG